MNKILLTRIFGMLALFAHGAWAGGPATPQAAAGKAPVEQIVAASFSASDPWTAASRKGSGSADVYMTLENGGSRGIHIEQLSTPVAEMAIAANPEDQGKSADLSMPPHGKASLRPGGLHIVLSGLKQPLPADSSFPLTFTYNGGALMTTDVNVLSAAEIAELKNEAESARPVASNAQYVYRSGLEGKARDIRSASVGMAGRTEISQ